VNPVKVGQIWEVETGLSLWGLRPGDKLLIVREDDTIGRAVGYREDQCYWCKPLDPQIDPFSLYWMTIDQHCRQVDL
jgi:hypothetical protein